ncbi:MAG: ribonuclease H [Gemmatimonadota bacterium]
MSGSAEPRVAIFADESCLGNGREGDNPGGAAGLIEHHDSSGGEPTRFDYWVSEPATTNNRMALHSAIEAFQILSRKGNRLHVRFTSDSQYLVKGMSEWVPGWRARGWRRKAGAIENLSLWQEAVEVAERHEVEWRWVRGHNQHPENEYADHLATRAARDQSSSGGPVPSLYGEWLAAMQAKGKLAHSTR